jgi:hypothetical protein
MPPRRRKAARKQKSYCSIIAANMFLGIKLEGWLTIIAIVVGPLLAFEVQRRRDNRRERRNRKYEIYRRLIMTLKVPLAASHVDAINSIQMEFLGRNDADKKVLDAWRLYTSHLNGVQQRAADPARWNEKKFDLLVDLVYEMGQNLGYRDIDKAALRDNTYLPQGFVDVETEWHQIRKAWLEVLAGQRPLPMTVVGPVQVKEQVDIARQVALPLPQAAQLPVLPPAPIDDNAK